MRHGFKAEAERVSVTARVQLGIALLDPIDPWEYAKARGVVVLDFSCLTLPERDHKQLLIIDNESWSGLTLKHDSEFFVVINPSHNIARQRNTLMHEIAHIHLGHTPGRVDFSAGGMMLLSDYPADQEDEADWLAAALLIPRDALYKARRSGSSIDEIADMFGVSKQLAEWRIRMTGIDTQIRRGSSARSVATN